MFDCPVVFLLFRTIVHLAEMSNFVQNVVTNFVPKPKIGFSAKMLNIVCVSYVQTNVCDRLKTPINGFRALLERYKKVKNWYKTKQKNCESVTCVSESLCESESL